MGRCVFSDKWLINEKFCTWVAAHPSLRPKARCKVCVKDIDVSGMGEAVLVSHMSGEKHKEAVAQKKTSLPVTSYLSRVEPLLKHRDQPSSRPQ